MDSVDNAHQEAWIKAAGYSRSPFNHRYLYAEDDDRDHLENIFIPHTGHFKEYLGPGSTIIIGGRGSGKTANCIKLAEELRGVSGNFVLVYDASVLSQATGECTTVSLKHHLHEMIRLGVKQLLKTKAACLSRGIEQELRLLDAWCQRFHPQADYQSRLALLFQKILGAGYDAFYLLIDERQSSQRESARTPSLLSSLLDESLFNHQQLYVKLFVPDELIRDVEDLCQEASERIQLVYLQWSENHLAQLLRALLRTAWKPGSYTPRAEELSRLARLIPDIDQRFGRAVATNAPVPRELVRLGQMLFRQCASHWGYGQVVSILRQDWTTALSEWHQFLAAERLVSRPAALVALRIQFIHHTAIQAKVQIVEPSSPTIHKIRLPYNVNTDELWAVLWALERFAVNIPQLPPDSPHINTLRKLRLVQDVENVNSQSVLISDLLERVGERLYEHLFVKSGLEHLLKERKKQVEQLHKGGVKDVRLWLELRFADKTVDLARFPWELLRHKGVFLFQTRKYGLTRYHYIEDHEPELRLSRPFSLLYIAPRLSSDHISHDRPRIEQAFRYSDLLQLREIMPPSYERLQQEIQTSAHQVFHYDGHGTFGHYCTECQKFFPPWQENCLAAHLSPPLLPQGFLQFEDGHPHGDPRSAHQVLHDLYQGGEQRLMLALLNACKSSAQAARPVFGGVSLALIRAGIPAVAGMLTSIEDKAAAAFVSGFYKTLWAALENQNLSDQEAVRVLLQALCEGRIKILSSRHAASRRCWWIPILNLRYKTGE